jgi:hypothetical protein
MSDTPRTDKAEYYQYDSYPAEPLGMVGVDFARQLERELAAAREVVLSHQDRIKRLEDEAKDQAFIASRYEDRYFATRELLNVSTERAETLERELAAANARISQLAHALDFVTPYCAHLHHPKRYQHKAGDPCPVEDIIRKAKETRP